MQASLGRKFLLLSTFLAACVPEPPSSEPPRDYWGSPEPAVVVAVSEGVRMSTTIETRQGIRIRRDGLWGSVGDSLLVAVHRNDEAIGWSSWRGVGKDGTLW